MLVWFKFQLKIPSLFGVCVQGECEIVSKLRVKYTTPSPPLSKDKGLRDTGHSMSIGNLVLGVNSVTVLCLIHYDSLLQNVTKVYYKMRQVFITKCGSYYKMRQFYYKMRQFLQIATFITNCDSTTTDLNKKIFFHPKFSFHWLDILSMAKGLETF